MLSKLQKKEIYSRFKNEKIFFYIKLKQRKPLIQMKALASFAGMDKCYFKVRGSNKYMYIRKEKY